MDTRKSDPANEPKPRSSPFRFEAGVGSEPPRLIVDFLHFKADDDSAALRQRVTSLETQLLAMKSTISMLQAQLEA